MGNQLERIRLRLGISRPEMLRAIGARIEREGMFMCENNRLDPIFVRRAYELEKFYDFWKGEILILVEAISDIQPLTIGKLAKIFGTYPMKFLRMRNAGILGLGGDISKTWKSVGQYATLEDVRQLFLVNEHYLEQTQGKGYGRAASRRAPLGSLFVQWLRRRKSNYLQQGVQPVQSVVVRHPLRKATADV